MEVEQDSRVAARIVAGEDHREAPIVAVAETEEVLEVDRNAVVDGLVEEVD